MKQTTLNMIAAGSETLAWCDRMQITTRKRRHRILRCVITCIMTESAGHMYANANIPASLALPYDAIGYDHNSVGLFQQQVGEDGSNQFGWGTVEQCMDIKHSTDAFLNRLNEKNLTEFVGAPVWERIQKVQVSAFPDGSNYKANMGWSGRFLFLHHFAIERGYKLLLKQRVGRHRAV